jgi:hypothetical protein
MAASQDLIPNDWAGVHTLYKFIDVLQSEGVLQAATPNQPLGRVGRKEQGARKGG